MRAIALAGTAARRTLCVALTLGALFALLALSVRAQIPAEIHLALASLESWESFQPSTWVAQAPITSSVQVHNEAGFHTGAFYQTAVNGTWSGWTSLNLQVVEISPSRRGLTVSGLSFAHSVTEDQNQIQFRIKSSADQWLLSPVYPIRVDAVPPTSTVGIAGWYASPVQIIGTASDVGSGVARVDLQLQRETDGAYFNGSDWQGTECWFSASGTTNWTFLFTATVQSEYSVSSRAVDLVGLVQSVPVTASFFVDVELPQSTVATSGDYRSATWPGAISGTATDEGSGLAVVQLRLQRSPDGFFFQGAGWGASPVWITTTGTDTWSLPFVPSAEAHYSATSRATDNVGNIEDQLEIVTFSYDDTPPLSSPSTAGCHDSWTGVITGTASDAVSGVAVVQVTIQRASDNLFYSGSGWTPVPTWLSALGTELWSLSFATTRETTYQVSSRATDRSGNVQTVPGTAAFTFDISPPQSTISTTGNLNSWPGAITGSAKDNSSGVSLVQVSVQRLSDMQYYNGTSWVAAPVVITASGTIQWTVPFMPLLETTYLITSRATDACGNVQTIPTSASFVYDFTPPQSSPTTSGFFNSWPGRVEGTASDNYSGVAAVQISLQRQSDNRYWNGTTWIVANTWLTATGTGSWFLPFTPGVETFYTLTSRALDVCGNVQPEPSRSTFVYDVTPPQAAATLASCYSTWEGAIRGTASDLVSGVDTVQLQLQRASDRQYYNGLTWSALATWLVVSGTQSWSLPFTPTVESFYTVTVTSVDRCGNAQTTPSQTTFAYDKTPPLAESQISGYLRSFGTAITGFASDATSGLDAVQVRVQRASDGYYYTGDSWALPSRWVTATGTVSWSLAFSPTVETTYTVTSRAQDRCGNVQAVPHVATFVYDITAPASPYSLVVTPAQWTPHNAFTVTWSSLPDLSGIVAAHFKWDAAPTSDQDESPGSPAQGAGISALNSIAVPVEGTHQLFLWLEDRAGNVSYQTRNATSVAAFRWDATPPNTSVSNLDALHGCNDWFVSTVRISLLAADVNPNPSVVNATSGISATYWRLDEGPWQAVAAGTIEVPDQGTHTVEYYSVDVAGNCEPTRVVSPTLRIDSVPPTTFPPSYTGTLGPNDWYRSPVSISLTALDTTSGISVTLYQVNTDTVRSGNSLVIEADGQHTLRYLSVDLACNQEAVHTATLKIDKTHPSTTHQLEGKAGDGGWFTSSPVTVTLTATDAVTGVSAYSGIESVRYRVDGGPWQIRGASTSFAVTVPPGQANCTRLVEYYAVDNAGNTEPVHSLSIGVDNQAPLALPFRPYVLPSGWTRTNCFDIRWFQNPQDCSGIAGAYYSFAVPVSATDGTLVLGDNLTSIPCIQVPDSLGDGLRTVYVWLRDKAGNSDHLTSHAVVVALDRAPPELVPQVAGTQCGTAGWYNSPITVTFVATDDLSGMAGGVISYQVNGGGWITGSRYVENRDGRYVIEARAQDVAGNITEIVTRSLKLDRTAPDAPPSVWVEPSGWSKTGQFTVHWVNPSDLSGLGGVYLKLGSPPAFPADGIYYDGVQSSLMVNAAQEGAIPAYIWLVDKACNSNYQQWAMATLRYDVTPPTTTYAALGSTGLSGWYVSPVTVLLNCSDAHSGCADGGTRYRLGDGDWVTGASFSIASEGTVSFTYHSVDVAGNAEVIRTATIRVDLSPPSSYAYSDSSSPSPSFTVRWDGSDATSGIAYFDVQYRAGASGAWQDWAIGVDPLQRSKLFNGQRGKTYYFRTRAVDKAGNAEPYPAVADTYVSVDAIVNGDFEREIGTEWERSGQCLPYRTAAPSYSGANTNVMVLGCPDPNDGRLFGPSMICQSISVPSADDMPAPILLFRYHIYTYDVIWGPATQQFYDSFHVGLGDVGQIAPTYVYTDGNPGPNYGSLLDMGWREGAIDLSPYAGRAIKVCLANVTRVDGIYNTWTLVDDIRIKNQEYRVALPVIHKVRPFQAASAAAPADRPHREPER
ncbi:MAG: hypothetical protein BWY10_00323 [Chloroflexi bacterium ADurb.Bin180]|nr:MAG: hypothetical protein BWY10_00323 [Chloroflexi bacterium ADurb.Bin180]